MDSNYSDYTMGYPESHTKWDNWLAEDEDVVTCPGCDGRGTNRWEDDDCTECWGEGVVPRELRTL